MSEAQEPKNNGSAALAKLLNQLNLPTLALILITGGSNWFATHSTSDEQRADISRAIRQVHDLHAELTEWEERQKQGLNNQKDILRSLDNQSKILEQLKPLR